MGDFIMDAATAHKLVDATKKFYQHHAESFSQTRQGSWNGWKDMLSLIGPLYPKIDVLDLACGNLRFEKFLADNMPDHEINSYAFDISEQLAALSQGRFKKHFNKMDIMRELERKSLLKSLEESCPKCVLSVNFAFMHHIPCLDWRSDLMRSMVEMTRPMGYICVSFWQISKSEKLLSKARDVTAKGCEQLGIELPDSSGDYLLDWNKDSSQYRYVHDSTDDEIKHIIEYACEAGANLFKTYSADGKMGDLNRYVILKRDIY